MLWRKICEIADIERGQMKPVEIEGQLVTVCLVDGQYFAFQTFCTHEKVSLADGYLEGCEVECPLHGSRFDVRTGECLSPPATDDIATFSTKVENGIVYIQIAS
jgi:3-phenylpropionate/trans-cinnamate dioxygenase ferredoxin component